MKKIPCTQFITDKVDCRQGLEQLILVTSVLGSFYSFLKSRPQY